MLEEGYGEKQSWMAQHFAGGFSVRSFHTTSHRAECDPYKLSLFQQTEVITNKTPTS